MSKEKVVTFKDLQEADAIVGEMYKESPELEKTKFGYAYERFVVKNYVPLMKELQEKLYDIRLDHALTDKGTNEVLVDKEASRGFKYDREGLKRVVDAERRLFKEFEAKEVNVMPFVSTYVPKNLSDKQKEVLTGLIL